MPIQIHNIGLQHKEQHINHRQKKLNKRLQKLNEDPNQQQLIN
jgi:hypothetical protein